LLAAHFLKKYGGKRGIMEIAPDAMDVLMSYDWPGNVRELESTIYAAVINAGSNPVRLDHLPKYIREGKISPSTPRNTLINAAQRAAEQARLKEIRILMEQNGNKVPEVARQLGISESY